ncbi:hypothetical protein PIB30_013535 [Stylosanthes scabra]|uniref:Methyltransferase small domain-containing protein n=1 Tax=Stylosanthes scabra TaxID=79078 RepID=A0ABU6R713_9FABA|nr:hypothetical protein [Stylosanthes scabra]
MVAVILNLGCGTGFLSLFCAQAGARKLNLVETDNSMHKASKEQKRDLAKECHVRLQSYLTLVKGMLAIKVETRMYHHHYQGGKNIHSERHMFLQAAASNGSGGESRLVLSTYAKPRLKWTLDLHVRFIEAVHQ